VHSGKPIAILGSVVENIPEDIAQNLVAQGIMPFCGMEEAIEAITVAAFIGQQREGKPPIALPVQTMPGEVLTEAEAKTALAAFGVKTPKSQAVNSVAALAQAGERVGFPLVLKGQGIAHKTEAGAVCIGLEDATSLLAAASAMPTDQFLTEEMVTGTIVELLVGVLLDPAHGYVLTLAAGGTLTEVLADQTNLILPVDAKAVQKALRKLRIAPLFDGYRGAPSADVEAITKAVLAVQDFVLDTHPVEVEINPLMCGPDFAIAADALITTGEPS
jgi:acyl-CoA synthetase (NDP forming)